MPISKWSMACEMAILDKYTNNLTLVSLIEQFTVPVIPIVIPRLICIVSSWEKNQILINKEERFRHRIKIISDPTVVRFEQEFENNIEPEKKRIRTINRIFGVPVDKEGDLFINIELFEDDNWKLQRTIPITIKAIDVNK